MDWERNKVLLDLPYSLHENLLLQPGSILHLAEPLPRRRVLGPGKSPVLLSIVARTRQSIAKLIQREARRRPQAEGRRGSFADCRRTSCWQ